MKTEYAKLGKEIQRIRKLKGYTQAQLAKITGLTGNYIGYLERGKQLPSLKTLKKISSTLGITVGLLFSSYEDYTLKPNKTEDSDKKLILINKLSTRLRRLSIGDIQSIYKIVKRMSPPS